MFGISSHMPTRRTVWYSVVEHGDQRFELLTIKRGDQRDTAIEAADDYHSNHDGWESRWPLTFDLYENEEGGAAFARFEVERESVPEFWAYPRALPDAVDAVDPQVGTQES